MCDPFFYEFRVSNSSALLLYITTDDRGLTLFSVLLGPAGGEGKGAMVGFVMEACQGGLH
jgi:hypothetical protein